MCVIRGCVCESEREEIVCVCVCMCAYVRERRACKRDKEGEREEKRVCVYE